MGNCCDTRVHLTQNDAENLIRESICLLKIRQFEFTEYHNIVDEIITVSMSDIEPMSNLQKWVTKENYEKIQLEYMINNNNHNLTVDNIDFIMNQKLSCLSYEELFSNADKTVYNNFLIFILAYTKNNTPSKYAKIQAIEKFIQKSNQSVTFSTFRKFLHQYITILIYEITNHFHYSSDIANSKHLNINYHNLKTTIFNTENIGAYLKILSDKCGYIIGGYSFSIGRDLSNSFMNYNHFKKFFNENSYLLDVIELRENFFSLFYEKSQNGIFLEKTQSETQSQVQSQGPSQGQ